MALSKEFYLDEIRSKYPNSYNEGLKDLPVKDLEDMLDFLDQALDKADGGAIGIEVLFTDKKPRKNFFMGGPALEGQALDIYNSMNAYGFSDQEIADALSARGLYTAAGSGTTQPAQVTGIIGSQLNQGDDGPKGDFGLFGDLDKSTAKEFNVEVYDEELGDFIPTTLTGYQNVKSGLFQTKEGKNIQPLFSNTGFTPGFLGALSNMFGLNKTVGGFKPGSIRGKYDGIRDIFNKQKKQQEDIIKQQQEKEKKEREARAAIAAAEMQQRNRDNKTGGYQFGYSPTSDFMTGGSSRPGGGGYGGGADLSGSMGSFKRGGLATMFTRRR